MGADVENDPCARCGYDLRGVADDAPCPECGLLAERSRHQAGHLTDASPGWLLGISVGVGIAFAAHVLAIAWPFISSTVLDLFGRGTFSSKWFGPPAGWYGYPSLWGVSVDAWLAGGNALAPLLLIVGLWLLTRPQQRDAGGRWVRRWLRVTSLVPLAAVGGLVYIDASASLTWAVRERIRDLIFLALTLGACPVPALMFILLRRLARRVLHRDLAEHAAIVGVGLSASLAAAQVVAWLAVAGDEYIDTYWSTRSPASLVLTLSAMVGVLLFGLWSALNCLRFALAFHRAYRGAKRKWRDADRAVA